MQAYSNILKEIIDTGIWKGNRTGVRCLTVPFMTFSHSLHASFPLLTTKFVSLKNVAVELEGFIKGIRSKKWFEDRSCSIWSAWSNPTKIPEGLNDKERKILQRKEDDLGKIYGVQWRGFLGVDNLGDLQSVDQFESIINTLKTNPDDRRMICSAWNPVELNQMALPACHLLWNLVHINGTLNLCWYQRSVDSFLGLPYNIASYSLLLLLLCKEANMRPGKVFGTLADCHIYENHLDQAIMQLSRNPYSLPNVNITENKSIFDWTYKDIEIINYKHHPKITATVAV